jgi:hypothetical protein
MSDDIEALLRSGLADRADAAPVFDDPGLADLAIAGAGRIRRRRRVAAAAGGAGLLVLGGATFAWNPWMVPDDGKDDTIAADTSTVEAQNDLAMEFLIEEADGSYSVLNQDGNTVAFDVDEPLVSDVFKLTSTYMSQTETEVWTVGFDGAVASVEKPSVETMTRINSAGDGYAMVTPNNDYSAEEYQLVDVSLHEETAIREFTTNYAVTLEDWDATTAVFTTDLNTVTGGVPKRYWFNDNLNFGLETVSEAGFETAVLVDTTDPTNVCISDLDAAGGASVQEQCGPIDSAEVQDELAVAAQVEAANVDPLERANSLIEGVIANVSMEFTLFEEVQLDEEYQSWYDNAALYWSDPKGRWEVVGNEGDDTWLLIDVSGEEPVVSELEPPEGAVMPILSYT